jgi:hypothetical protein
MFQNRNTYDFTKQEIDFYWYGHTSANNGPLSEKHYDLVIIEQ